MDARDESTERSSDIRKPLRTNRAMIGRAGEEAAAHFLLQLGFTIIARNWRCRLGELDLIAEYDTTLIFVEVRSRTNPTKFGTAVEAVTPRKCRQVRELAMVYMKHNRINDQPLRFDVVAVTFNQGNNVPTIKHFPGAF